MTLAHKKLTQKQVIEINDILRADLIQHDNNTYTYKTRSDEGIATELDVPRASVSRLRNTLFGPFPKVTNVARTETLIDHATLASLIRIALSCVENDTVAETADTLRLRAWLNRTT